MPACYDCNSGDNVHTCFFCGKHICERCGVYRDFKWFCSNCA